MIDCLLVDVLFQSFTCHKYIPILIISFSDNFRFAKEPLMELFMVITKIRLWSRDSSAMVGCLLMDLLGESLALCDPRHRGNEIWPHQEKGAGNYLMGIGSLRSRIHPQMLGRKPKTAS